MLLAPPLTDQQQNEKKRSACPTLLIPRVRLVHTPICCPSRSELVTGKYFHNLKTTGGGCMHVDEGKVNPDTFALHLHNAGYTVGMFGKARRNFDWSFGWFTHIHQGEFVLSCGAF